MYQNFLQNLNYNHAHLVQTFSFWNKFFIPFNNKKQNLTPGSDNILNFVERSNVYALNEIFVRFDHFL